MSTLITDLDQVTQLAASHHDEFEVMRYMLEADDDIGDQTLDRIVDDIAAPIIAAIDCTQCANCCRSLDVYITDQDARRLAEGINIPVNEIIAQYIDRQSAAEVEEWGKFRSQPCTFLSGKRCRIYAHRPETCRTYPAFTPDFRWTLTDTIAGAGLCPIIYNVLIAMLKVVDEITGPTQE